MRIASGNSGKRPGPDDPNTDELGGCKEKPREASNGVESGGRKEVSREVLSGDGRGVAWSQCPAAERSVPKRDSGAYPEHSVPEHDSGPRVCEGRFDRPSSRGVSCAEEEG
jgi:hypothetical protein